MIATTSNNLTTLSSVPDFQFNAGSFNSALGSVRLGKVRLFRIPNSKTETHIIPIEVENYAKVCYISPSFTSPGMFQQDQIPNQPNTAGQQQSGKPGQLTLMLTKDLAGAIFTNFYSELMLHIYPQLLEQIQRFADTEASNNRSLPPFLAKLLDAGIAGRDEFVKDFWSLNDTAYLKVAGDAMIFSKPFTGTVVSGEQAQTLTQQSNLPRRGIYKVRVLLRYLYLGPSQGVMKVQLTLMADQVFFCPETSEAPTHPVMDVDTFFTPMPEHVFLQQALEACGIPTDVPLKPQKSKAQLQREKKQAPSATQQQPPMKQAKLIAPKPPVAGKPTSYVKQQQQQKQPSKKPVENPINIPDDDGPDFDPMMFE